ncbi:MULTISPECIES: 3-oxoacid CoA-transferase subunit B [Marivita]|jgi:3-oxoacid CoA-transferase subunit B|uniref:CoA transferase subunit B n=1 Tax=Marivita cryptomonadis TaxID=505252 RepID=A0A9Q2PCU7_9RHOB|nr:MULTISPECIES: 3-oxoacid CoA-transferase subunit B [Marivita]MCR9167410.1 3-oxoacid CoA-transferase subunit B [Paracoccaceae bacterium]MBM2322529.1 CoA transferase subunit B [Marivita cryptomonadis]MBM2332111.1 CoA transferase subunit B [Marivita cryptomonadis]MBM2341695.1 CoA transferase subunit B [Marivita cryptomonadis]MBM2346359.1 CoA transferase subunit B [Marivita cryptomonadis]
MPSSIKGWDRNQMAARAAQELEDGMYVNLGIGIPTLVANYVGDKDITLQSENGMLGMGPFPFEGEEDADLINAGKQTITELNRTSYFDSATSFGMIRGGKIAAAILGAMEVSERGDLANWMIPGKLVKGMGGAMDLVAGVGRVIVVMDHTNKHGESKVLRDCTLPLTGKGVVDRIITNLGVLDVTVNGLSLVECADGVTRQDIIGATEALIV